jgi:alpha-ribazole phosphatase
MRLILVRHAQPLVAAGVCYGRSDLAVDLMEQQRLLRTLTASLPAEAPLFSSPLRRCAELARHLPCASRTVDARLAEMDFGTWELRRWDRIERAEIDAWAADIVNYRPGGGESVLQMAARVVAFDAELSKLDCDCAIVVCHAGTMRLLAACQPGRPLAEIALQAARAPHRIAYGGVLVLER